MLMEELIRPDSYGTVKSNYAIKSREALISTGAVKYLPIGHSTERTEQ
jgi:hypothetical protein